MLPALLALLALAAGMFALVLGSRYRKLRREAYIREAELPRGLFDTLRARHPQLTLKDCQLVAHGLRQFFLAHLKSGRRFVAMPSQVADDLWHEFILHTRAYEAYCQQAFGGFLHHTPAVALSGQAQQDEGLRRCWRWVCREEHLDPLAPTRLPLLFALDAKLGIAGGFHYRPDCQGVRREGDGSSGAVVHCGSDLGRHDGDGGADSPGGDSADGGGGDGGGCGGGD